MNNILHYIIEHAIKYFEGTTDKSVAYEVIVDNPIELIRYAIAEGYYISAVLWWDRVRVSENSKIGSGGYLDPRDPENYYFAETFIFDTFNENTTFEDYVNYISKVYNEYSSYDIYPSFDICKHR